MSKPTGGKVGRPPKQIPAIETPETPAVRPRPTDPIAAVLWDMGVESAKPEPNATRSGLLREQLAALTRAQDRADGIANDQQRIDLKAAQDSITDLETWADDDEEMIRGLQQGYDELQQTMTVLEAKVTSTIAAAAEERRQYLAQCPGCAAGTVTISELQDGLDRAKALAEKCAAGMCPTSVSRQAENDRLRGPARRMEEIENTIKGIEDERKQVIAAREYRASVLAEVVKIRERRKPLTAEERERFGSAVHDSSFRNADKDNQFLADNAGIIAEDDAATARAAAEKEHQMWLELRSKLGSDRMKILLAEKHAANPVHRRYEDLFSPKEQLEEVPPAYGPAK
jgi:hypothetical protein